MASVGPLLAPIAAAMITSNPSPAEAQSYSVGETVEMHIGSGPLWRPCTVIRNVETEPVMRLRCPVYKTADYFQGAGEYVVERRFDSVRKLRSGAPSRSTTAPARPTTPPKGQAGGSLKVGEYACYGSGSRVMAGLGFKVLGGGRYTDLDGKSSGRYSISGGTVTFRGGHLGGQTGRELTPKGGFRIGAQANCEPW
jgi:hypothetical protein